MSVGDIRNTVGLLSPPPNNYFKTLKYDTLHWNKKNSKLWKTNFNQNTPQWIENLLF